MTSKSVRAFEQQQLVLGLRSINTANQKEHFLLISTFRYI